MTSQTVNLDLLSPARAPSRATASRSRSGGLFPLLCTAVLLEALGIGALFPLLARIQDADHFATFGLGVMSGANFFATLATQVAVGRHLDGRRAPVLLAAGLALGAGASIWFGLASSLWTLAAARALGGVSYGIVMPAALRAAAIGVDPRRRGARLGRVSSVQMAGIVLGPMLGTALASIGGLRAPFLLVGAATAVVLVVLVLLPAGGVVRSVPASAAAGLAVTAAGPGAAPEPGALEVGAQPPRAPSPLSATVVALLLLAAASQLPTGLYDSLWSRLLTDRGASSLLIGLSLSAFGVPFVVLAPLGGRLASRRRPLQWAAGGLALSGACMVLYGVLASPLVITGVGLVEACAQAVAVPAGLAAVAASFPDRFAATGQSWFSGAGTAAAGTSALLGAPAYAAFGPTAVFAAGATASVVLALASVATARRAR
jgi:MFS family permease